MGYNNANISKCQMKFKEVRQIIQVSDNATLPIPELEYFEEMYSTPFTIYEVPPTILQYWVSRSNTSVLYMPKFSTYIPDKKNFPTLVKNELNKPEEINPFKVPLIEVWILPRSTKYYPKVIVQCKIMSNFVADTEKSAGTSLKFFFY